MNSKLCLLLCLLAPAAAAGQLDEILAAHVELINAPGADADAPWQLRVTLPDGFSRDHFLDRHSHRVVRARDVRAFHPSLDAEEIELETLYSGDLWTDGVLRSARSENRAVATGEWLGTTQVRSIEHNVELPEGYFGGE